MSFILVFSSCRSARRAIAERFRSLIPALLRFRVLGVRFGIFGTCNRRGDLQSTRNSTRHSQRSDFLTGASNRRRLPCQGLPNRYVLANTASWKTAKHVLGRARCVNLARNGLSSNLCVSPRSQ